MKRPAEPMGAAYACEQTIRELEGASSLLFTIAEAIERAEDDSERAGWAASISFIARALVDAEEFARDWVKFDEKPEEATAP